MLQTALQYFRPSDYMSDFCHKTKCIYKTIKFKASIQFAINYGPSLKPAKLTLNFLFR